MDTDQNNEALRAARQVLDKSVNDLARAVLTAASGKEHDGDLKDLSVVVSPKAGKIIFRANGVCGVLLEPPGVSRLCTEEESKTYSAPVPG